MGLKVSAGSSGKSFANVPPGTHVARSYQLVDIGTQKADWEEHPRRKIIIWFEVPNETIDVDGEEKPLSIKKTYTASLHEKSNLRAHLEAWRNKKFSQEELKGFDLKNILGKPCMLSVLQGDKGGTYITSISALPKGTECPDQWNEDVYFDLDDFNQAQFDAFPEWLKEVIAGSPEYKRISGEDSPADSGVESLEDDIPF